jgi:hypothetical protein
MHVRQGWNRRSSLALTCINETSELFDMFLFEQQGDRDES